ncbi:hypothetical protein [Streptomyces ochraceiscleroticus]|uniref:Uncharacterized protein n=1 Tax=Streptomyces ochraceiscleroticus TaxID=47761 RepID=A0ABW1MMT2_9ACTN|nr:hypothetical protein [Streptomyces ochraceiscleroticus]
MPQRLLGGVEAWKASMTATATASLRSRKCWYDLPADARAIGDVSHGDLLDAPLPRQIRGDLLRPPCRLVPRSTEGPGAVLIDWLWPHPAAISGCQQGACRLLGTRVGIIERALRQGTPAGAARHDERTEALWRAPVVCPPSIR